MRDIMNRKKIRIISVPIDLGASLQGASGGPSALRIANLTESLQRIGYSVSAEVIVNVPIRKKYYDHLSTKMNYRREILSVCQRLALLTKKSLEDDEIPLIVGGDHSIAMGSVSGVSEYYRNSNIGLVWFDAHGDMNTPSTSPSGNVHGMPLSHLLGQGDREFCSIFSERQKVQAENVAIVGVRDMDCKEKILVRDSGVSVFTMSDIDRMGMEEVSNEVIRIVTKNTIGFHVSFDVDGCDPVAMPGTGTKVPGGVTYRESHHLLEKLARTQKITSMDMVEINPFLDEGNVTAERAVSLIQSAFGLTLL
ncbi:arginase [Grimontia sp. NTOU-MAR1]|uniref:arginase n=1 Tax=Grimontia sp. NTOU-MAR1 TaxID=3111011 RepID=UPI002DBECCC3|nr:arginase [Grimontia sp. NTOU-MAR1]WRW01000.1 arginase [Grimontia sp. NTOU-MAR1]